ncbi:MAG: TolC family protein [Candidatus Tectomicrobia bacterium]|nr:TolC family protein [Candidatus Tectomicrobia bacterium]
MSSSRSRRIGARAALMLAFTIVFTTIAALPAPARTTEPPSPRVLSLDEAVALAVRNSPEIKAEQFAVLIRQSQRAQADAARFAQMDVTIVGGPSPRARGDQMASPDSKNSVVVDGAFGLATFNIVQPLYAFGKINNLRAAAEHGMAVEEARVHQKATEVAMLVHEAYYGYLLAASLEKLALEIGAQLGGTLNKVQRQLDAQVPGVDNVDLFKLQTFQGQLEKQLNDILQGKALALAGLRTLTGLAPSLPIELADARLRPLERQAPVLEEAISDAHRLRPEFVQAREGVKAFERLLEAAEADYYPLVFVGLFGNLAEATNRSRLSNPFLYDPLMDDILTPLVGMQWHFDLGVTAAKVDEVAAELGQVQQQSALAEQGIPFQVRQAYLELEQHQANITATRKGFRSGRQWLVAAMANFDLGVGEGKDVAEAAVAYAQLHAAYFQAVYNFNLGLARLDHRAGRDVAEVREHLPPMPQVR